MSRLVRWIPLGFAAALIGCPSDTKKDTTAETTAPVTAPPESTAPSTTEPETPEVELPKIEGPVATVNGTAIGADQFLKEFKTTLERYQKARHPVKPELRERLKDNIVRRLVDAEIIQQQAKALNIHLDQPQLEEKWKVHKQRYGSDEAFQAFLKRAGTTETGVREQFELNMVREKVFATVSENIEVTSQEVKDFYETNKKRYYEPEQVRASHILIRADAKADGHVHAEKQKLAGDLMKKSKLKGAKFEDIAKEFGEDPTRSRGGDLGFFTRGRMVKAFEDAVWKMKIGDISDVVQTNFGYHVIKKTGHKKEHQKSFKEVSEQIERAVKARKRNSAIREALQKWKDEAKVEIFVKGDPAVLKPSVPGTTNVQPLAPKDLPIQKVNPPTTIDRPTK